MGMLTGTNDNAENPHLANPRLEQDVNPVTGIITSTRTPVTGGPAVVHVKQLPTPDNPTPIESGGGDVLSTGPTKVDNSATGAISPANEIDLLTNAYQRLMGQGIALPDAGQPTVIPTSSQSSSSLPMIVTIVGIGVSIYLYRKQHHHASE